MTAAWTQWSSDAWRSDSPYVDWWQLFPADGFSEQRDPGTPINPFSTFLSAPVSTDFSVFLRNVVHFEPAVVAYAAAVDGEFMPPAMAEIYGKTENPLIPLPDNVENHQFQKHMADHKTWEPDEDSLDLVSPNTVIVGVIDAGISLGNQRFRDRSGERTRILAAWQQGAARDPAKPQDYLPFGQELYKKDIDAMIDMHSKNAVFAEHDFNREAGLVDMVNPHGTRDLAGRHAHGTMVLDLAAGSVSELSDDLIKIIAVNLPNRRSINNSGIFLDYFTLFAVKRIADLADLIFRKSRAESKRKDDGQIWPDGGFPIVINLSFGKNAGSKDGLDHFSAAVHEINTARRDTGRLPLQLVIPVGNHNLDQGNAVFHLDPGAESDIDFKTLPEDQSSNFLEIWSDPLPLKDGELLQHVDVPLEIAIVSPNDERLEWVAGHHKQSRMLGQIAKLYCYLRPSKDSPTYKVCYTLCTAPTLLHNQHERPVAPSGRWRISIRNKGIRPVQAFLSVQTDQSIMPHAQTGLLARLEHPDYRRCHETTGRCLDSCDPPSSFAGGVPDSSAILRRHGSINSTAASSDVIAVAGYRASDGRPADYSATGQGAPLDPTRSRAFPSVALPTDDSPALFGAHGAGAASGSVVAMRGTSFAAASATRIIAEKLKEGTKARADLQIWLEGEARKNETHNTAVWPKACEVKIGKGRLLATPSSRMKRGL
jgi:hypothetical protein